MALRHFLLRQIAWQWMVLVGLAGGTFSPDVAWAAGAERPLRVLFIGNSYTFYNHLPLQLRALGAARGKNIDVGMVAIPGATLEKHWADGRWKRVLAQGPWDYVVIQGQSQEPFKNWEGFSQFAHWIHDEIHKTAARTVLYATWGRQYAPSEHRQLADAYQRLAVALDAVYVPVGQIWESVLDQTALRSLYQSDGAHPSALGSYLAAVVFFQRLTQENPVGLPRRLMGKPQESSSDREVLLVELSEGEAALIQQAVQGWVAVK